MPPNWNRFKNIVQTMIEDTIGGEPCTLTIPATCSYDFGDGEIESGTSTTSTLKGALIPTSKDDEQHLPEGFRDKVIKKIFTVAPLDKTIPITSDFDGQEYEIVVPSVAYQAGGLSICYRTYLGRVENQA